MHGVDQPKDGYDWNDGEQDHEGEMVLSQLHRIHDMSKSLLEMIGENDEFPAWTQYKLGRAYDDLTAFFSYIESMSHVHYDANGLMSTNIEQPMSEGKKKKKRSCSGCKGKNPGMWCNICRKKQRGEAPAKPGDPDRPDQKTWKKLTKKK